VIHLISLFVFFGVAFASDEKPSNLQVALAPYGIKVVGAEKFLVKRQKTSDSSEKKRKSFWADDGSTFFEVHLIEPLAKSDASLLLQSEEMIAARLYEPRRTPYSDQISLASSCGKELRPIKRTLPVGGTEEPSLIATASSTRTFGVCQKSDVAFIGALTGKYDEGNKRLMKLSVFVKSQGEMPEAASARIIALLKETFPK